MENDNLNDLPLWGDPEASEILMEICSTYHVPMSVIKRLVALQRENLHRERAHGINQAIEEILDEME